MKRNVNEIDSLVSEFNKKSKIVYNDVATFDFLQDIELEYDSEQCYKQFCMLKTETQNEIKHTYMFIRGFEKDCVSKDLCKCMLKTPFWIFNYPFTPYGYDTCPFDFLFHSISLRLDATKPNLLELNNTDREIIEGIIIECCFRKYSFVCSLYPSSEDCLQYLTCKQLNCRYQMKLKQFLDTYEYLEEDDPTKAFIDMILHGWLMRLCKWEIFINPQLLITYINIKNISDAFMKDLLNSNLLKIKNLYKRGKLSRDEVNQNLKLHLKYSFSNQYIKRYGKALKQLINSF